MRAEILRDYCLSRPGATEDQPFGPGSLVFKVAGKMFALLAIDEVPVRVALKCDPERAVELRERYAGVTTAPYMSKVHWNAVSLDGQVPAAEVREMVDESHRLVVAGLPKAVRMRVMGNEG